MKIVHTTNLQDPTKVDDNFIKLNHLDICGLSGNSTGIFWIREEWKQLWNSLATKKNYLISGPPGCGKSSLIWWWCLSQSKPVFWVHFTKSGCISICIINNSTITPYVITNSNFEIPSDSELIVFDGITDASQLGPGVSFNLTQDKPAQFIAVSSLQVYVPQEELNVSQMSIIACNGWTFEEYQSTCQNQNFLRFVSNKLADSKEELNINTSILEDILQEKFFLAGHSARFMFNFTIEEARQDISKNLERINSVDQLTKGLNGNGSDDTVNHLFSKIDFKTVLVSQYVTRELSKKNYENFIKTLTIHSKSLNNGSFDGWVFQMDFLETLRKAVNNKSTLQLACGKTWKVINTIDFYREEELENENIPIVDGTWIIPSKVNHGCYDVAQYTSDSGINLLRIVQLTVANTHSLKLQHVLKLLSLKPFQYINSLEVVFVVPEGIKVSFHLGNVEGDKNQKIKKLKWKLSQIQIYEYKRAA